MRIWLFIYQHHNLFHILSCNLKQFVLAFVHLNSEDYLLFCFEISSLSLTIEKKCMKKMEIKSIDVD
ncbi:hypothetical protein L1987_29270 [Smallanthus sonchifolius]|uniref:Uncharacterized protein n=1 Tax=Smallanthus sonchifolius TaxID=185202 RepID=A0ACB9I043_9ASTR|nr:hypothetical protein L1987_29270 [Smallanthus sonchifolius]